MPKPPQPAQGEEAERPQPHADAQRHEAPRPGVPLHAAGPHPWLGQKVLHGAHRPGGGPPLGYHGGRNADPAVHGVRAAGESAAGLRHVHGALGPRHVRAARHLEAPADRPHVPDLALPAHRHGHGRRHRGALQRPRAGKVLEGPARLPGPRAHLLGRHHLPDPVGIYLVFGWLVWACGGGRPTQLTVLTHIHIGRAAPSPRRATSSSSSRTR